MTNTMRGAVAIIATVALALTYLLLLPPAEGAPKAPAASPSADACRTTSNILPRGDCGKFRQVFAENFNGDRVPRGAFSDCNHYTDTRRAYCGGLSGQYRANWWAYPTGWHDTAKSGADGNTGRAVGGVYHPETTVSVGPASNGDGRMKIRMWRPASGGDIHSAAVVPKKLMQQRYGKYTERFKVTKVSPGYKSAHLFYGHGCEMDHPEGEWTGTISAFHHACDGGRPYANTRAKWTGWHTTSIEWTPNRARYYLDGKKILDTTKGVPNKPLSWILQNESALEGPYAKPGSSAQIEITWVAGYAYRP